MKRHRAPLIGLAVLLLCTAGVQAIEEDDFNVDIFFGWGGCYRPQEWTPISVNIQTDLTEPYAGVLSFSAPQDSMNQLNISHEFVLTPGVPLHIPLSVKLAFAAESCDIEIHNRQSGRRDWDNTVNLWDFTESNRVLTALNESDLLIGLVGHRRFGLLRLGEAAECVSDGNFGKVYLEDKIPRMTPWDWTGYMPVDLLLLYDPEWSQFNAQQLEAIADWVRNGGRLLVVLGANPLPKDTPLTSILPVDWGELSRTAIPTTVLREWNLAEKEQESAPAWQLQADSDGMFIETVKNDAGQVLYASAYRGFGRVGVLPFDPTNLSEEQAAAAEKFWVGRIASLLSDAANRPFDRGGRSNSFQRYSNRIPLRRSIALLDEERPTDTDQYQQWRHYATGFDQMASNAIMEHLHNISELRPLSIWWVILILLLLAVLLGPVDYLVLKRLDRLPLTWVTSTLWIALFTVAAYYGVQFLRAGTMQVRSVTVMDQMPGERQAWVTLYTGLFAPRSDDYQFARPQEHHERDEWWSGVTPTQDNLYYYTQRGTGRNIYCAQFDGANVPYSLPINIWTMQCLVSESATPYFPMQASVTVDGGRCTLEIENYSDLVLEDGYVQVGLDRRMEFGRIEPQSRKTFEAELQAGMEWDRRVAQEVQVTHQNGSMFATNVDAAFGARGALPRTQTTVTLLGRGAALVCGRYRQAPPPIAVDDYTFEHSHIQLARQIVIPNRLGEEVQ